MQKHRCEECSHLNKESNQFCSNCGVSLNDELKYGPRLVMIYGDNNEVIFPLREDYVSIGRDSENHIVLGDEKISKNHAAIVKTDDFFAIKDLDSRNGVYVNGTKVETLQKISGESLIKLGFTFLRFKEN
ncbi:MAG: FHA domain-containing protein [Calditrichia bacterium]